MLNSTRSGVHRMWRLFLNQLIQDVPDAIALCEFDCRKKQCTYEEWVHCERRRQRTVGELTPASDKAFRQPVPPNMRAG
jgi:hypothetical protein